MLLLRLASLGLLAAVFLLEVLQLPESVLLPLSELGIRLLDEDHRRHLNLPVVLDVLQLHQVDRVEVEAQHRVVVVELLAQVRVDDERAVVVAEVSRACNLHLHHLEALFCRRARHVHIVVGVLDVQHNKLGETVSPAECAERVLPVGVLIYFVSPHGEDIDHLHERRDLIHEHQRAQTTQVLRQLPREQHQVVLADGRDLHGRRVLVICSVTLKILRDQLLGLLEPARHAPLDEVDQPVPVRLVLELEINTVVHLLDAQTLLGRVVLDDQLLEEQERALVVDSLSKLHLRDPQVRRVGLLAVVALEVHDHELDDEALLEERAVEHLLLDGQLDLDALGVGLGPDEARVDQLHSLEAVDVLEADGEELSRLECRVRPGRAQVTIALSAVVHLQRLRDALSDVDLRLEAVDASVGLVRHHQHTADAASTIQVIIILSKILIAYILFAAKSAGSRSVL